MRHPTSTKRVVFYTGDEKHNGFFVKDINRYIRGVNRWKDTDTNEWFDDEEVEEWEEQEHSLT